MDRNFDTVQVIIVVVVALRKESVDRNPKNPMISVDEIPSLSARRAWIEMLMKCQVKKYSGVALRKESVDRNIDQMKSRGYGVDVALRKESVDRNLFACYILINTIGRSPQGERG